MSRAVLRTSSVLSPRPSLLPSMRTSNIYGTASRAGSRRLSMGLNNATSPITGHVFTPFSVKLFDTVRGKQELGEIHVLGMRRYTGHPFDHVHPNAYANIEAFVKRLTPRGLNAVHSAHDFRTDTPKLNVTYIGLGRNGYTHRKGKINLEHASGKVSILKNSPTRRNAINALFPGSVVGTKLHANAHNRDLSAWAVPCPEHRTIYIISNDVLFHEQRRIKDEGLVLLALLGCKLHGPRGAQEAHLVRVMLKKARDGEKFVKSKILMSEAKLRKLIGNTDRNVIQRMYNVNRQITRQRGAANRQQRRRRRANQGDAVGQRQRTT